MSCFDIETKKLPGRTTVGMVKFLLRPMRRFVQAEIRKELAALQAEIAALRRDIMLRDDLKPMIRQMEAALLAIALSKSVEPLSRGRK
jgi:hypothetical protein